MIKEWTMQLRRQRASWITRAVVAGFFATAIATGVLLLAYAFALLVGSNSASAPIFQHWLWGLAHNVVTDDVATALPLALFIHLAAGIGWAVIYAGLVEPRLPGPGWERGLLFAPIPAILSLVVFLPIVGAGFLGLALGAGLLPVVGNVVLHLVYGTVLGAFYSPATVTFLGDKAMPTEPADVWILRQEDLTLAIGIVGGFVGGALLGVVIQFLATGTGPTLAAALFGAIIGVALGALIGSYLGLSTPTSMPPT